VRIKITTTVTFPVAIYGVRALLLCYCMLLLACGGGSSNPAPKNNQPVSSLSFSSESSSAVSSLAAGVITLSGTVTYDFIPHNDNQVGLNYSASMKKAGRGLVIELLDASNRVVATTNSDNLGNYSFSVEYNKLVKVRAKAQLLRTQLPTWNFRVTDNTSANSLYVMDGSLTAATETTAIRDLHAASGWSGTGYTQPRVAAPFAILDSVLIGADKVVAAGNNSNFPALELRWSTDNKAADGELTLGEIGTSFYSDSAIYILGDENNDTDEYDRHVILHEWGHYLERAFSRSDSIGGNHMYDDKLDIRVAMSEGFANAFSAMMLDDPDYRDASGVRQAEGFFNNISQKNNDVRGWYSEASVQSVLYNFYISSSGKSERNFADIFSIVNSEEYAANIAMTSIFVFADVLRNVNQTQAAYFNDLLLEQNISITNAFAEGESNSGGYSGSLPLYSNLSVHGTPVNVCSTNWFGSFNKLAVAQFLLFDVPNAANYRIVAQKSGADSGEADPDIYLYSRGVLLDYAEGTAVDQESLSLSLQAGTYVVELVDDRARSFDDSEKITACFEVRAELIN